MNLKDRAPFYTKIDHDIRQLSAEILRLSKLPYRSTTNITKIWKLDDQIRYLEEILAAFEKEEKKY